jgi:hypothetical protein
LISNHIIRVLFQIVMALVYAGMGIWLLLDDSFGIAPWNLILGSVFLVYGIWRGYRAGQSGQEN